MPSTLEIGQNFRDHLSSHAQTVFDCFLNLLVPHRTKEDGEKMKFLPILLCATPLLAACSSGPSTEDALRSHGYSQVYVAGYHSGCESGKHAGGDVFASRARDESAYGTAGDYKTGWDYGFLTCKQKQIQNLEVAVAIVAIGAAASVGSSSSSHGADGVDARSALKGVDTSAIQAAGW